MAPEAGWRARGWWQGGDDGGAVTEARVLSIYILHAQPSPGLAKLVCSTSGPAAEVTLASEVKGVHLVPGPRVSPANKLRDIGQADSGACGNRARGNAGEARVGRGGG